MRKKPKYKQGYFVPENPKKYKGNVNNIIYRSGLELKYFKYCDLHPSVLEWSSEEVVVPYISDIDGKAHRYFVDLMVKAKTKDGTVKTFLVEIKPYSQTLPPKVPKKGGTKSLSYIRAFREYVKNTSKWKYAEEYCKQKGYQFVKLTEKDI